MQWFRIDNRLVHGQVIEAWLPHVRAKTLVVANDDLAADELRQEIMSLAVPSGVTFLCCPLQNVAAELERLQTEDPGQHMLVLFATCADARAAHHAGVAFFRGQHRQFALWSWQGADLRIHRPGPRRSGLSQVFQRPRG